MTTCIGLPAAYVLARQRGVITRLGLGWILISQMFPLILIIIPLFLLLRDLELTDSHVGLVLVYVVWALPFVLWMLHELRPRHPARPRGGGHRRRRDAASRCSTASSRRCSRRGSSSRRCSRSSRPGTSSSSRSWSSRPPSSTTLPLELAQFVGIEGIVRLGPLAASALLATLPSLVLFVVIQRWLTRGLLSGAVKG